MGWVSKTWANRSVQHAGRYVQTPTGNLNEYDLTRSEGTVFTAGDKPDATTLNDLETRIGTGFADVGALASLTTTVKTSIVNAINWLVSTLLPTTVNVKWVGPKQAVNIYGQSYKYFWVPYKNAHLYTASNLVTQVSGMGGYTGTSIVGNYNNGVQILDTSTVGDGFQIEITFTLTKI
jgi:hypothetical protein